MKKPSRRRVNADSLRFNILTNLPKYSTFKNLDIVDKDLIIEHLIKLIDECTEEVGDLYS